MSGQDNVIRFPVERRQPEVIFYPDLITVETDAGTNACPTWGHIWSMGSRTCLCGKETK